MRQAQLVHKPGTPEEQIFPFMEQIEIGRSRRGEESTPGRIVFSDPRISSRHCIVSQSSDGRFFVRDLSRNGTRVDGKRLIPNLEFEIQPRQTISLGSYELELLAIEQATILPSHLEESTIIASGLAFVTILVGDIRGYTQLSQSRDSAEVSRCVRAVFSELEALVIRRGGSVKEYQGDAIFVFWEEDPDQPGRHTAAACDAALALHARVEELAGDAAAWSFRDTPLRVDWALTTGAVVISSFGKDRPTGMSMIGDAVNLAFRLEKFANDATGPILICKNTRSQVASLFDFKDLGTYEVAGRQGQERVFALLGRRR